jgi:hypothetical protein
VTKKKLKAPKKKRDEIDVTEAAGLYIDFNGDLKKLKAKLGRKWTMNDLRWYEERRHWPLLLSRTRQRVDDRIVEDAVQRRSDQLARLRNARIRLYQQIVPPNGQGGVGANTMEGCASALTKVIEMEREVTGDKYHVAPPSAGVFIFLRDRILREGTVAFNPARANRVADGDSTDRFSF